MRSHHERKIWIWPVLLVAATCAGPALGQHWIRCADTAVLDASGYPGPKRKYTLQGNCKVYAQKTSVEKGIEFSGTGPHLPFEPYIDTKYGWKVVGEFFAFAKVSWNGETGETKEGILAESKKLYTQTNCIKDDPFIKKTSCANAAANGDVDMRILTAIMNSKRPVFAGTVTEGVAATLSQLADKGGSPPPPPPPPKAKIPSGKKEPVGSVKAVAPIVPVSATGQKRPGGGSSKAMAPGSALLVISPTPGPTRPVGRRLRLPPTVTPTPAGRRAARSS